MTTYLLRPTNVTANNVFEQASVVGGTEALSDDDDSTYVRITELGTIETGDVVIEFPAFTDWVVASVQFVSRYQQVSGDSIGRPTLFLEPPDFDNELFATQWAGDTDRTDPEWGEVHAGFVDDISAVWTNLPDFSVPTTMWCDFANTMYAECDFRVYEIGLLLTMSGDGGSTPLAVPAVRQYPRDDALGLGSAPRIHPPPTASRLHGGL